MSSFLLLNIIVMSFVWSSIAVADSSAVVTPSGPITGKMTSHNGTTVMAYLGIPYAKPPTGNLRFKKPVPLEPWSQPLKATRFKAACIQHKPDPHSLRVAERNISLDCLYLNIWVPANVSDTNKKTVMIWFHGGSFTVGGSIIDLYNGVAMAARGNVIVVTFNYRLGAEGFFYSSTEDAPGNMGVWDVVTVLKWVRKNIESFGGDKDSITLFGQSAGAMLIGMMCTLPVMKSLFKRVIIQSGAPTLMDERNERTVNTSKRLAEAVGCGDELYEKPESTVECMRGKDPYKMSVILGKITEDQSRTFYPRFGDVLFPTSPRQDIINGHFHAVDVLIGSNSGDGASYVTQFNRDTFGLNGDKDPQINRILAWSIIEKNFERSQFPCPFKVANHYLCDLQEDDYASIRYQVIAAQGDYMRTCPANYFAESFAKKHVSVYCYFFAHRAYNSIKAPWMLAGHGDEVPFAFGYPLRRPHKYTPEEQEFSRRMLKMWTDFAKTGVPENGWPLYSKGNAICKVLDVNSCDTVRGPHEENCEFFRPYFKDQNANDACMVIPLHEYKNSVSFLKHHE